MRSEISMGLIKQKLNTFIVALLFVVGIFTPTSINSNISQVMLYVNLFLLMAMFALLILLNFKLNIFFLISFICINLILAVNTLFSPFVEYSYGASVLYFLLSVLFCLNLKDIKVNNLVPKVFIIVNILNLVLGFFIVNQNLLVKEFFTNYYNDFYPELMVLMMAFDKPVLTFSTHSIAGFYFFIFAFLNFKSFEKTKKVLYLCLVVAYLILGVALNSVTGYLFVLIGLMYFLIILLRKKTIFLYCLTFFLLIVFIINWDSVGYFIESFSALIQDKLTSERNGFIGRYSQTGGLRNNLEYISENPFRGVGIGFSPELMYADSGIIETALRGTFFFTLVIYLTLFMFLYKNLKSKNTAYLLFFVLMLFEIGFSNLVYFRTLYLLPFIIVYLNYLEEDLAVKTIVEKNGFHVFRKK
ncbi:putative membrane protein [Geobacillus kaustophilus]|uniref:Putative membrane protein n=1 Tax=Geobacillus kaustophilus TaxID=1462 RepID=A0A0D8BS97_GEOKU|nr:hypothetical protein [Geobacillus kaustophilus]KJE27005.1 putative membrane protein [Geobacillus kaustophilus]